MSRTVPNAFGVNATAQDLIEVASEQQVEACVSQDALVLGDGTNVLITRPIEAPVLLIRIDGIEHLETRDDHRVIRVGAGVVWDRLVRWAVDQSLWGIENLALIPGRCGAAPIQNIGAYGAQLSDVLISLRAWDRQRSTWIDLSADALELGYRDSLLRRHPGRYIVTTMELALSKQREPKLDYPGIVEALGRVDSPSPRQIADAVTTIRKSKLPDPNYVGNAGSFFKNPIVDNQRWLVLRADESELIGFPDRPGHTKISAARLVELCGWKGYRDGDAGVSDRHALVLVNHGAATGAEIWELAKRIQSSVEDRFDITLEPEPIVI